MAAVAAAANAFATVKSESNAHEAQARNVDGATYGSPISFASTAATGISTGAVAVFTADADELVARSHSAPDATARLARNELSG